MKISSLVPIVLVVILRIEHVRCGASAAGDASATSSSSFSSAGTRTSIFDIKRTSSKLREKKSIETQRKMLPQTEDEIKQNRIERTRRIQERRESAKEKIREIVENPHEYSSNSAELISENELVSMRKDLLRDDPNLEREESRLLWNKSNQNSNAFADPFAYYNSWAQAYRMLGLYIECDNAGDSRYYYYNNKNNDDDEGCKRWVVWAAYANPNYQGFGISEYIGDYNEDDYYGGTSGGYVQYSSGNSGGSNCVHNDDGSYHCYGDSNSNNNNNNNNNNGNNQNNGQEPMSKLDCHDLDSEWLLLGVYREEFADYFEQISKHMWYYNSYEYVTATDGLDYIGDGDCEKVGSDEYGNYLYKAPRPIQGGGFEMGLYTDTVCIIPYDNDEVNADNVGYYGNHYYNGNYGNNYYGYNGGNVQEYTLTLFNEVFESFKYCTLCLDYPSYQDGYFNGDGYDDDDLINQCWKFYSHDTDVCDSECVAAADMQGTINAFRYGDKYYGTAWDGSENGASSSSNSLFSFSRSKFSNGSPHSRAATLFLMASTFVFVLLLYAFNNADDFHLYNDNSKSSGSDDEARKGRLISLLGRKNKEERSGVGRSKTNDETEDNSNWFGNQGRNTSNTKSPWFSRIRSAPITRSSARNKESSNKKRVTFIKAKNGKKQTTSPIEGKSLAKSIVKMAVSSGTGVNLFTVAKQQELSLPKTFKQSRSEGNTNKPKKLLVKTKSGNDREYQLPSPTPKSAETKNVDRVEIAPNNRRMARVEIAPFNRSKARFETAPNDPSTAHIQIDERNPSTRNVRFENIDEKSPGIARGHAGGAGYKPRSTSRSTGPPRTVAAVLDRHKNSYHAKSKFVDTGNGHNRIV